ncbi:DNA-directed DNA polymerase II small subunit [Archaeoglobales archaeon]|nr:MAG: DNA-directed DNA polymerase II small subunit [Archaeoglobales archaeon]
MVIKDIESKLIITKFAMHGYNVHPSAIEILKEFRDELDDLIPKICRAVDGSFILTSDDILPILNEIRIKKKRDVEMRSVSLNGSALDVTPKESICVLKDVTGVSACEGNVDDFVAYFNSRFEKLSRILRQRFNSVSISNVKKIKSDNVEVIGMVKDVRETQNGNVLVELEDNTDSIRFIATGKLKDTALELMGDEVIGVTGVLRGNNIIADRIVFPDVPLNGNKKKKDFSIVFISDTHFGSKEFLEKEWDVFVKWLNFEVGNEKMVEVAESVRYVVLAGDVVDGVGVYPNQDKDLAILDVYGQYEEAARQIEKIPKRIKVIVAPGNHDAVRQAEPQPALPKEFANLFSNNVMNVGNPSLLNLDGLKLLIYHGRSLDDVVTKIPRLSYSKPQEAMVELLKRRHLAPMYGGRSPIAPEKEDYLVIDEIPDILHGGHVHTYGTTFYRGVFVVNSSTWQAQTEFQKKVNLNPMPCNVAVYTPGGEVVRLKFYGG